MKHVKRSEGNMINHEGIIRASDYIKSFTKSLNGFKVRDRIPQEDNDRVTNILGSLKEDLKQFSTILGKTKGLVQNRASDEKRELVTNLTYRLHDNLNALKKSMSLFIKHLPLKELDIKNLTGALSQAGLKIDFSKNPSRSGLSFAEREQARSQQRSSSRDSL